MHITRTWSRCLPLLVAACLPSIAAVHITENTAQRLCFTWEMEGVRTRTIGDASCAVSFKGQNTDVEAGGGVALPALMLHAGAPPRGEVSVVVAPLEITTISLPHPLQTTSGKAGSAPTFVNPWISQPAYVTFRGQRAVRLVIRPFAYDRGARSVRALMRATCVITFPPSGPQRTGAAAMSDYQRMLKELLLNYDVARGWAPRPGLGKRAAVRQFPLSSGTMVTFTVGDGHADLNETTVNENGLIKLTADDLRGLGGSLPINRIRLFASVKGEMVQTTPGISTMPDGVSEVPLLRGDRDGDGILGAGDSLAAYVSGGSDWIFDSVSSGFVFRLNRYDDYRHYWVVLSAQPGATMGRLVSRAAGAGDSLRRDFVNQIVFTRPVNIPSEPSNPVVTVEASLDWIWAKLTPAVPRLDFTADLPGIDVSQPGAIRFDGVGSTTTNSGLTIGNLKITDSCTLGIWQPIASWGGAGPSFAVSFTGSAAMVSSQYEEVTQAAVRYRERLDLSKTGGFAILAVNGGAAAYRIDGLSGGLPLIFRIAPDESQVTFIAPALDNAGAFCTFVDSAAAGVKYYVCAQSAVRSLRPDSLHVVGAPVDNGYTIRTLRASHSVNYLIVTHPLFAQAALDLAAHKALYASIPQCRPAVVDINDVYREFSGGNVDPAALRNFLAYAVSQWSGGLEYVVLLGGGHYDYKNILASLPVFMPIAEVNDQGNYVCVDDFFANVDSGHTWRDQPGIFLGRISCTSALDAEVVVEKIRDTEDPSRADFGGWRTTALLVADDDMQGAAPDHITDHHVSSEEVGRTIADSLPAVDIRKVYLYEYPRNEFYEKPEATRALADEINNGVAYVNWFGHGSDVLWADEHILAIDNLSNLHNAPHYPLFSSFSCEVGKFDKPDGSCLSSALLMLPKAGGVATVSSTRLAYASANTSLAQEFYGHLFSAGTTHTLGMAFREAMTGFPSNKQYVLLGDPSIRFVDQTHRVGITVLDRGNRPLDTIMALQRVTVTGVVTNFDTTGGSLPDAAFGTASAPASVQISLYNPSDTSQRKDGLTAPVAPYTMPGSPVFIGRTDVVGGKFSQTMLLPRNLSFDKPGVRLSVYAWRGSECGLDFRGDIIFDGTDPKGAIADTSGPRITVRPVYYDNARNGDASFTDRIVGSLPLQLEVGLHDESGLDIVGTGPDEGLSIEIPGALSKRNVNNLFRFKEGDFTTGTATVSFEKDALKPGTYALTISAKDLLGNGSRRSIALELTTVDQFRLGPVFNYPNPMRMGEGTRFFFYASAPSYAWETEPELHASIRIYTLSGRLIRVLDTAPMDELHNGVLWRGDDQFGRLLSPNVYLYRIIVRNAQQVTVRSGIQKLVIHPPR